MKATRTTSKTSSSLTRSPVPAGSSTMVLVYLYPQSCLYLLMMSIASARTDRQAHFFACIRNKQYFSAIPCHNGGIGFGMRSSFTSIRPLRQLLTLG